VADQDRNKDSESEIESNPAQRDNNESQYRDDVAEDRNLSGSSTWLNLPDKQPKDADGRDQEDSNDRNATDRDANS
jgi:hypothetical protein